MELEKTAWGTVSGTASGYIDLILMESEEPLSLKEIQKRVLAKGFDSRKSPSPHLSTLKKNGYVDNKSRKWFKTAKGESHLDKQQLKHFEVTKHATAKSSAISVKSSISQEVEDVAIFPEEAVGSGSFIDGATRTITVNAYERDPKARRRCIAAHGTDCSICAMSFGKVYGPAAEGLIHVHHLRPLSEVKAAHLVDPVKDLRPVCPNCHAVLHRRVPAFSIEEVRAFIETMNGPE